MGGVRVWLLGGFRVAVGDVVLDDAAWRLRKAKTLLKLLALAPGHGLLREELLDTLWPDLDPQAAANNLKYALHVARRTLDVAPGGRACLVVQGERLVLTGGDGVWVDVAAFEAAAAAARARRTPADYRAALDLYGGDLLPDDRYEDWASLRREELQASFIDLLLELAACEEANGDEEAAVRALAQVVARDSAHEDAHRALMRLHAAAGRPVQALRQYDRLRDALRRELDATPSAATDELRAAIAAGLSASLAAEASQPRHNLPAPLTTFIGRESEWHELVRLLAEGDARLVTLTGAAGCGKTRLALEVAWRLVDRFPDGVWLVDLAPLADPRLVLSAVATALDTPATDVGALAAGLRSQTLLLVLDNCEHLLGACASLTHALLRAGSGLRVLATSRHTLGVDGEQVRLIPPLALPRAGPAVSPEALARSEAVRLFVERAALVQPEPVLTPRSAPAVAELVRRLDGIPLALELAAARTRALSVEQIVARLDDRFRLLVGSRTSAPRHQTLRTAVEWSYALLDDAGKTLFRRLGVFAGGWTIAAAEAVCAGESLPAGDVLGCLAELVDWSLVVPEAVTEDDARDEPGELRYRLLETLRQFAFERLMEAGEFERLAARHAAYFLAFGEELGPRVDGAQGLAWQRRLSRDVSNLRAALSWYVRRGEIDPAAQLASALYRFWDVANDHVEGVQWLQTLLELGVADPALRARTLRTAAALTLETGRLTHTAAWLEESLALFRRLGDEREARMCIQDMAILAIFQGNVDRATALVAESVALARALGEPSRLAGALFLAGFIARQRGDLPAARASLEESLALCRREALSTVLPLPLTELGHVALAEGQLAAARAAFEESLAINRTLEEALGEARSLGGLAQTALSEGAPREALRYGLAALALLRRAVFPRDLASCLELLASTAAELGRPEDAGTLAAAAGELRQTAPAPCLPAEAPALERLEVRLRATLGAERFAAVWERGRGLARDEVAAAAHALEEARERAVELEPAIRQLPVLE